MNTHDSNTGNAIGHLTLALSAIGCGIGLRGTPAFVWIAVYAFSALAASAAWKEKPNLSPLTWLFGTVMFGGLTALMYVIGVRVSGSANQPWMVFGKGGIVIPALALISVSGFARALYVRRIAA